MYEPDITSRPPSIAADLLRSFSGKRVVRLVRYSWWPKELVPSECHVQAEDSFALTAGPLAIGFEDGSVLGISSDPAMSSVIVWPDRAPGGTALKTPTLDSDAELFPIEANDVTYSRSAAWGSVVGQSLNGASLLRSKSPGLLKKGLPCEVALSLRFGHGASLIGVHGLHDSSDDFAVLGPAEMNETLRAQLEELKLF